MTDTTNREDVLARIAKGRKVTAQEIFDVAVTGVIRQGGPSTREDTVACLYRGPNGRSCGVGQVIPDSRFKPAWENIKVASLIQHAAFPASLRPHAGLLSDIQGAHDISVPKPDHFVAAEAAFLRRFKVEARDLAARRGLTLPAAVTGGD